MDELNAQIAAIEENMLLNLTNCVRNAIGGSPARLRSVNSVMSFANLKPKGQSAAFLRARRKKRFRRDWTMRQDRSWNL